MDLGRAGDRISTLVLHAPDDPWVGESVKVVVDRGYVATAVRKGSRDVSVRWHSAAGNLAAMESETVYINHPDPDVRELLAWSAEDLTADVCSRG